MHTFLAFLIIVSEIISAQDVDPDDDWQHVTKHR